MYKRKRILAVIPARGGSKGIPNKNIIEINGRPLIDYSISEALKSSYIDKVVLSTDSKKIALIGKKCGADVPFLRPKYLAKDDSKTIDVLIDLIKNLKSVGERFNYIILLQPTQPLRRVFHIDEAIKKTIDNNFKSLVSVNLVKENPLMVRTINKEGILQNLIPGENSTVRRQDFPNYYKVNGAIYINRVDKDFNKNTSLNDNLYPYLMGKKYDLDIDEPFDLEIMKMKLQKNP